MAVEAQHLNIFHPQILGNREMMTTMTNGVDISAPLVHGVFTTTAGVARYGSASNDVVKPLQSESGLTYAAAAAVPAESRKRAREFDFDSYPMTASMPIANISRQNHHLNDLIGGGSFSFLGEDISPYLLQQQSVIDRFTANYTDKVRLEMQQRRIQYSRRIAATFEATMTKKLKAKEEEIERIAKLNSTLEDRVKSLSMENQLWRELAQSNEATANALRSNLEQILDAKVRNDQLQLQRHESFADDAQSCCGSNYNDDEEEIDEHHHPKNLNRNNDRICRSCCGEESSVLILPCRHLCLCPSCSSTVHACPVCNSTKTASLHVNLSS